MAKSFNSLMQDRFKKITGDYNVINKYVHETAVMIAKHAAEHNDCSTAQGLVMAMPASLRREMLILWFSKFTPIVVKNSDDWTAKMHKPDSKLFVAFDIEGGEAMPFYELAKQNKERPPLQFEDIILIPGKQAKRLEAALADGKVAEDEVETVKALIVALRAIKVRHIEPTPANDEAPAPAPDAAAAMAAAA